MGNGDSYEGKFVVSFYFGGEFNVRVLGIEIVLKSFDVITISEKKEAVVNIATIKDGFELGRTIF